MCDVCVIHGVGVGVGAAGMTCTENLQQCIESEKNSTDFVPMPPHFLEVAAILFEW